MNKKFSVGITISLIALACAVTFVLTMSVALDIYNQKIAGVQQREEIYTKLQEVDSYVRSYSMGTVDESELTTGIINGYIGRLSDKYAKYYTTADYYKYVQKTSGTMTGLGIEAIADESGYIKITRVYENSTAFEAGIAAGDVITKINGTNVLEAGAVSCLGMLDGDEGTKVTLKVQRSGAESDYTLERTSYNIVSVNGAVLNNYGYIHVPAFNELTRVQFSEMTDDFTGQGVSGFIIDLRGCNGGVYDSVEEMLDKLAGTGTAASAKYKDASVKSFVTLHSEESVTLPITVLVNETTSGPAELFAVGIKDLCGAELVGNITAGNGTIQEIKPFSDGSAVEVTIATIIPAVSEAYNEIGIKPEYAVELSGIIETAPAEYETITDAQLLKAFEVVETHAAVE